MGNKKTLLSLIILALVCSTGLSVLITSDANADEVRCTRLSNASFFIGDEDNPVLGDVECGTLLPPVAGDGHVVIAGKSGNINAKCTGEQLLDLLIPDSAFVTDGFCCAIKIGPGIGLSNYVLTTDSHAVLTPSGNVEVVCKAHPEDVPQED